MQSRPTWWLVKSKPCGEMNDPEPPLLNRTEDRSMWPRKSSVTLKPYFFSTACFGNWLTGHIPSSARQSVPAKAVDSSTNRIVVNILYPILAGNRKVVSKKLKGN